MNLRTKSRSISLAMTSSKVTFNPSRVTNADPLLHSLCRSYVPGLTWRGRGEGGRPPRLHRQPRRRLRGGPAVQAVRDRQQALRRPPPPRRSPSPRRRLQRRRRRLGGKSRPTCWRSTAPSAGALRRRTRGCGRRRAQCCSRSERTWASWTLSQPDGEGVGAGQTY